jgi:hypothetical protein
MNKPLISTLIASHILLALHASAYSFTYDLTSSGIGQELEESAPDSTGTQVDGIFTTTISLPSPGGEANGDGFGPATGDANEFDEGEVAAFTITLDSISTTETAASFMLSGFEFDGVGEDSDTSGTGLNTLKLVAVISQPST